MVFLATYWWIFLIGAGAFTVMTVFLQLRNMRKFMGGAMSMVSSLGDDATVEDAGKVVSETAGSIFAGFKGVAICSILASGCGILTVIGVVVALIEYFKVMS